MSQSRFEVVRKYWPERKIFQGAATAYARYSEKPQMPWTYLERPMWEHVFSFFDFHSKLLDVGAGSGKLTELALVTNFSRYNIVAHEPNTILRQTLQKKLPIIQTMRGSLHHLSDRLEKYGGERDLIAANMVFNHIETNDLKKMLREIYAALLPVGYLAFVVPSPEGKARKHGRDLSSEWQVEEVAPWGGFTEYHHRSLAAYWSLLDSNGYSDMKHADYGYEDTLHEFQLEPYEDRGKHMRGPKRLLVVARKNRRVPASFTQLPSIGRTSIDYDSGTYR